MVKQIKDFNTFLRILVKINFIYMEKNKYRNKEKFIELDGLLQINDDIDLNQLNCDIIYNNKENIIFKKIMII